MSNHDNSHKIIGDFLSSCASLEYVFNLKIEQLFDSRKLIDILHRADVKDRWQVIKETITAFPPLRSLIADKVNIISTSRDTPDEKALKIQQLFDDTPILNNGDIVSMIEQVDKVISYYESSIKPIRDVLAHSPLVTLNESKSKIVQSRRYKESGINSLDLDDVEALIGPFHNQISIVWEILPKFTNANGQKPVRRDI